MGEWAHVFRYQEPHYGLKLENQETSCDVDDGIEKGRASGEGGSAGCQIDFLGLLLIGDN